MYDYNSSLCNQLPPPSLSERHESLDRPSGTMLTPDEVNRFDVLIDSAETVSTDTLMYDIAQ